MLGFEVDIQRFREGRCRLSEAIDLLQIKDDVSHGYLTRGLESYHQFCFCRRTYK